MKTKFIKMEEQWCVFSNVSKCDGFSYESTYLGVDSEETFI